MENIPVITQMAEALERIEALAKPDPEWPVSAEALLNRVGRIAHDNLERHRAEPEEK